MIEYDENIAIQRMRDVLPNDASAKYDDDQLLNLVDIIWDYYEQNGLLDIDLDNDNMSDEQMMEELLDYALRMLKKDKNAIIDPTYVPALIEAELNYEAELDEQL